MESDGLIMECENWRYGSFCRDCGKIYDSIIENGLCSCCGKENSIEKCPVVVKCGEKKNKGWFSSAYTYTKYYKAKTSLGLREQSEEITDYCYYE